MCEQPLNMVLKVHTHGAVKQQVAAFTTQPRQNGSFCTSAFSRCFEVKEKKNAIYPQHVNIPKLYIGAKEKKKP